MDRFGRLVGLRFGCLRDFSDSLVEGYFPKFASRRSVHLAYGWPALIEINGHAAYISPASWLVGWFTCALALRRRDKGKPAARRGRKAHGPLLGGSRAAETAVGSRHRESPKER